MKNPRNFIISSIFAISAILPNIAFANGYGLLFSGLQKIQHSQVQKQQNTDVSHNPSISGSTYIKTPGLCPQHYPLGYPQSVSQDKAKIERRSFYLCEDNYAVQFDPATKTPLWSSETLKGSEQAGTYIERVDAFQPHPQIPKPAQASLNDYKGSKFDRGHMSPAADMLSPQAMEQSFYLSNMVPQVGPNMNRGIWAELESMTRKWSESRGEVLVISGPIFGQGTLYMGTSQVWIPTHTYKIILDPKTMESLDFIIPNQQVITRKTKVLDKGNPNYPQTLPQMAINCGKLCILENFIVSIDDIEKYTGFQFFPNLTQQQKLIVSKKGYMWHVSK
ncbi:hypothetical protein GW796_07935 [archaeon]|nr:hypothetical protein [archaeon]